MIILDAMFLLSCFIKQIYNKMQLVRCVGVAVLQSLNIERLRCKPNEIKKALTNECKCLIVSVVPHGLEPWTP